jgi:hypothetical protein
LEHINRRAPSKIGVAKIREMDFRDLVSNLANLTLEVVQANCSDLSAHRQQWMRFSSDARSQEAKNSRNQEIKNSAMRRISRRKILGSSWILGFLTP